LFVRSGQFEAFFWVIEPKKYFENHDINCTILHTSGHAKLSDLKKLVNSLKPETIIPIHSFHAEKFQEFFPNVRLVKDREVLEL